MLVFEGRGYMLLLWAKKRSEGAWGFFKNNKMKHMTFSLFDFDIWLGREWEITLTVFQIGQRSLLSFSAGKNWKTSLTLFYYWAIIDQEKS